MSLGHASEDLAKQAANVNYEQAVSSSDIHPVGQLLLYKETDNVCFTSSGSNVHCTWG
ncbi:uncharacterized protein G6M90_00g096660 [Metarhizium brunneum]|uniref:Uncharacterized protein n=1 Tax=Metarhizium brunneum TaxID=500148 RepID=A0A7D5YWA1_9HYPO|nr:hypothetical protein G6M90_00g096660 [Metarhizium brunneum]